MEKKYWLTILPHVYYVQKHGEALVYNTLTGENIHTQNVEVLHLLEQMHDRKNLGVTGIDEITQHQIDDFIKESVSKNICNIREMVEGEPKPIQLMPILNLQKDIDKLKQEDGRSFGEGVLHYLSDITIHINGACGLHCQDCTKYIHQFFHCSKLFNAENIDFELLKQFLQHLAFTLIRRLAITGGNIFLYPHFSELIAFLQKEEIRPLFGIHYGNVDIHKMKLLRDFPLEIFVTFPLEDSFAKNMDFLSKEKNVKIIFEITSEETYNDAESLISRYTIENYAYKPFYNGNNQTFFKDNIYLNKDDVFSDPISQRMIFAHQKLNTNFFGKIHLFPNGDIKAHPSKDVIGNYEDESIIQILEKEIVMNSAWRIVRNQTPCNECLYQFLCPSPSDYEWVMSRNNLCNVSYR
jgi:pseudo-rSAM protein